MLRPWALWGARIDLPPRADPARRGAADLRPLAHARWIAAGSLPLRPASIRMAWKGPASPGLVRRDPLAIAVGSPPASRGMPCRQAALRALRVPLARLVPLARWILRVRLARRAPPAVRALRGSQAPLASLARRILRGLRLAHPARPVRAAAARPRRSETGLASPRRWPRQGLRRRRVRGLRQWVAPEPGRSPSYPAMRGQPVPQCAAGRLASAERSGRQERPAARDAPKLALCWP